MAVVVQSVILTSQRQTQEDHQFEASPRLLVKPCLKKPLFIVLSLTGTGEQPCLCAGLLSASLALSLSAHQCGSLLRPAASSHVGLHTTHGFVTKGFSVLFGLCNGSKGEWGAVMLPQECEC